MSRNVPALHFPVVEQLLSAGNKPLQVMHIARYRGTSEILSTLVPSRPCPLCFRGLEELRLTSHQPDLSEVLRTCISSAIALGNSRTFQLSSGMSKETLGAGGVKKQRSLQRALNWALHHIPIPPQGNLQSHKA